MNKDWTGNNKSIYTCLGASNHTEKERQNEDYYATDPIAIDILCAEEKFSPVVYEVSCGEGHMSKRLEHFGYKVASWDLIDRGYGETGIDFLEVEKPIDGDIITNPPYKFAKEFVEHGLSLVSEGSKVCMFLKLQFMEGKGRKKLFLENPPKTIYVSSSRISCAMNGEFEKYPSSAVAYAWYVWEKGFNGKTTIQWFN